MSESSRSQDPREGGACGDGGRSQDVSHQALSIARTLDRLCLVPGDYALTIHVPAHRRQAWEFELSRLDRLRRAETRGAGE